VLIIGGGKSVNENKEEINNLKNQIFTIGCNYAGIDFETDVICCLDFDFIKSNLESLKKINKLIISRDWGEDFKNRFCSDLDVIWVRNDVINQYKLTGDFAVAIAKLLKEKFNYEIYSVGLDGGKGHYDGYKGGQDNVEYPENKEANRKKKIKQEEREDFAVMNENKEEIIKWLKENLSKTI